MIESGEIDLAPHLKHDIVHDDGRVTHVSSVHYQLPAGDIINETCVFFPDGYSEVRGRYDDHDRVVDDILFQTNDEWYEVGDPGRLADL